MRWSMLRALWSYIVSRLLPPCWLHSFATSMFVSSDHKEWTVHSSSQVAVGKIGRVQSLCCVPNTPRTTRALASLRPARDSFCLASSETTICTSRSKIPRVYTAEGSMAWVFHACCVHHNIFPVGAKTRKRHDNTTFILDHWLFYFTLLDLVQRATSIHTTSFQQTDVQHNNYAKSCIASKTCFHGHSYPNIQPLRLKLGRYM